MVDEAGVQVTLRIVQDASDDRDLTFGGAAFRPKPSLGLDLNMLLL